VFAQRRETGEVQNQIPGFLSLAPEANDENRETGNEKGEASDEILEAGDEKGEARNQIPEARD